MTSPSAYPPGWYSDPWQVAPWRWWDGQRWTPVLFGPYGIAWPTQRPEVPPSKGPGIQGGGVAAVGIATGFVLSTGAVVAWALTHHGHLGLQQSWVLLVTQVALWIGFAGAPVVASRRHGSGSLRQDFGLGWPRWRDAGLGLLAGLAARAVSLVVVLPYALLAHSHTGREPPTVLGTSPNGPYAWALVVVLAAVGAPVVEELLFRGLIQGAFSRRTGVVPAIFITALIFSAMHITSEGPAAPFLIFPSAVVLGWLRYRTGRLAAGMVAHAAFNASLFLLLLIPGLG